MPGRGDGPERRRVLVVDDEEQIRALVRMVLRDLADIDEVATAADALDRAPACAADLIILDARLPDGRGMDVARRLRELDATRATPILMVTGDAPDVAGGVVDEVLTKPFDVQRLRALAQRYLEG